MRQLTDEEVQMEKLGLERNEKEVKSLQENLAYNVDLIAKQNYLREHDDKWRDFLRIQKDNEDKAILEAISKELTIKKEMVKQAKEHIKKGVEVKVPTGTG